MRTQDLDCARRAWEAALRRGAGPADLQKRAKNLASLLRSLGLLRALEWLEHKSRDTAGPSLARAFLEALSLPPDTGRAEKLLAGSNRIELLALHRRALALAEALRVLASTSKHAELGPASGRLPCPGLHAPEGIQPAEAKRRPPTRILGTEGQGAEHVQNADLAYHRLAPTGGGGDAQSEFVRALAAKAGWPRDYRAAFERWLWHTRDSELGGPKTRVAFVARSRARLLVGLGEPSPTENGLSLHPLYGVPLIPGTSLKGVARAYCREHYRDDPNWGEHGEAFRELFGTPGNAGAKDSGRSGAVRFLDAWWVPDEASRPLAAEIATVHHRGYYEKGLPPDGTEAPNPVTFLAAQGAFRVVLEGPVGWVERAAELLGRALEEQGVGAKTRAGYGRLQRIEEEAELPLSYRQAVRKIQVEAEKERQERWEREFRSAPPARKAELLLERLGSAHGQALLEDLARWAAGRPAAALPERERGLLAELPRDDDGLKAVLWAWVRAQEYYQRHYKKTNKLGEDLRNLRDLLNPPKAEQKAPAPARKAPRPAGSNHLDDAALDALFQEAFAKVEGSKGKKKREKALAKAFQRVVRTIERGDYDRDTLARALERLRQRGARPGHLKPLAERYGAAYPELFGGQEQ